MWLLDSSAWIDIFSKKPSLRLTPTHLPSVMTCPPVLQEVLQGIKDDLVHIKLKTRMLAFPCLEPELSLGRYLEAGELFRLARRRGLTVRSSIDCLVAAIAIHHRVPVLHRDRDFTALARISALQVVEDFRA